MGGRRAPGWRDEAAAALLLRHLPIVRPAGPILVMGDPRPDVGDQMAAMGLDVVTWDRRAIDGRRATPWPPEGPFGTVALRLPRAKKEFTMALHGAAGALKEEGSVLVYGAKDEGIGSAAGLMETLFHGIETVGLGGHCRILRGRVRAHPEALRGRLEDWRVLGRMEYGGEEHEWISYPGVFAHGHLDPGTGVLLNALPALPGEAKILDFGCGSGVVGAMVRNLYPQVRLTLLDIDSVAVTAARENVSGARILLGDGLPPAGDELFDMILTNPPFHRGKAEEPEMILRLIREAPSVLERDGRLVLVAQRRLALEGVFRGVFREVGLRADEKGFRVWEGRGLR